MNKEEALKIVEELEEIISKIDMKYLTEEEFARKYLGPQSNSKAGH